MPDLKFVITGTGRSGTGFLSQLFTTLGYPCGHEKVFTAKHINIGYPKLVGDSSWLAAPHLDTFDGIVIHVVRHPLLVAKTTIPWLARFIEGDRRDTFYPYMQKHVSLCGEPHEDMLRYWVQWNHSIAPYANIRLNIETISGFKIFAALKLFDPDPPPPDQIQKTIDTAPGQWLNHRVGHGFSWNDFEESEWKTETLRLATEYGYDPIPVEAWTPVSQLG